ncbi:hypothetical protein SAMN05444673_4022 [Bacillus sp. OV166]|uniref:hypothetical protein n=1 Tax=Bacillus sp. OV166 TaxID=1882763 RepID=UPI000A2AEE1B|nr:hypothetical protein [Bacillus sp. OV166]SMQ80886.1 hypothetical protein SAMN05444673_4022 [Bacillus sp. OV166]
MDKTIIYILGATAGWLLVQVADSVEWTLNYVVGEIILISWLPAIISMAVALMGWIVTIIFSIPVIKIAWKNLRSK